MRNERRPVRSHPPPRTRSTRPSSSLTFVSVRRDVRDCTRPMRRLAVALRICNADVRRCSSFGPQRTTIARKGLARLSSLVGRLGDGNRASRKGEPNRARATSSPGCVRVRRAPRGRRHSRFGKRSNTGLAKCWTCSRALAGREPRYARERLRPRAFPARGRRKNVACGELNARPSKHPRPETVTCGTS